MKNETVPIMVLLHWYCFISILAWMQFWINFKVDLKHTNKATFTLLHISTGFHSVVVSMSDWQARGPQFKSRWGHFPFFFLLNLCCRAAKPAQHSNTFGGKIRKAIPPYITTMVRLLFIWAMQQPNWLVLLKLLKDICQSSVWISWLDGWIEHFMDAF